VESQDSRTNLNLNPVFSSLSSVDCPLPREGRREEITQCYESWRMWPQGRELFWHNCRVRCYVVIRKNQVHLCVQSWKESQMFYKTNNLIMFLES
jgi:hypothetical protein